MQIGIEKTGFSPPNEVSVSTQIPEEQFQVWSIRTDHQMHLSD